MTLKNRLFLEQFSRGAALFNCGGFFEAHEVWEDLWRTMDGAGKKIMQGLIQAAAGAHHLQRGNRRGAEALFRNALAKFSLRPAQFCLIDLRQLRHDLKEILSLLRRENSLDLPQLSLRIRRRHPRRSETPGSAGRQDAS